MRPLFLFIPLLCSCVDVAITPIKDDTGDTNATDTGTDTATVVTGMPTITSLSLAPNPAFTDDILVATAESDDGYGAPADLIWSWSVNGSEVATEVFELDGFIFFEKGDTVSVSVTPLKDEVAGDPSVAEVVVSNSPPAAPSIQISPSEVHEGGEDMICETTTLSTDSDGDSITYSVEWELNGALFSGALTTNLMGDTVASEHLFEGDVWTCTITPRDEEEEEGDSASVSTTILESEFTTSECTNEIASLSIPTEHATASGGGTYGIGAFVADSGLQGDNRLWVMMGYNDSTILEYPSLTSLQASTGSTSIELDDDWDGTGHVVMNGIMYTNVEDSEQIVATDLATGHTIATGIIADLPANSTGTYSYGGKTYVDLNVDGESLYVIHSTNAAGGRFVVSELDPVSLALLNSWIAPTEIRANYSEAFIACGVLYGVDTSDDGMCFWCNETTVDFSWELATNIETKISVTFTNPGTSGYIGGVSYNPADGLIYVTRGGALGTIVPTFR